MTIGIYNSMDEARNNGFCIHILGFSVFLNTFYIKESTILTNDDYNTGRLNFFAIIYYAFRICALIFSYINIDDGKLFIYK